MSSSAKLSSVAEAGEDAGSWLGCAGFRSRKPPDCGPADMLSERPPSICISSQRTLDVDLAAFAQILPGDLGEAAEKDHPMPLRALLVLTALLVPPGLGGGYPDVGDRRAIGRVPGLRIRPQVADKNDFVNASRHQESPRKSIRKV
jgi:hypothetical protein